MTRNTHNAYLIDRKCDTLPNEIGQVPPELAVRHRLRPHSSAVLDDVEGAAENNIQHKYERAHFNYSPA